MSLPSIQTIVSKRGMKTTEISKEDAETIILEAMEIDLKEGLAFLRAKAHEASGESYLRWGPIDPRSAVSKQIMRILASDAMRAAMRKHSLIGHWEVAMIDASTGFLYTYRTEGEGCTAHSYPTVSVVGTHCRTIGADPKSWTESMDALAGWMEKNLPLASQFMKSFGEELKAKGRQFTTWGPIDPKSPLGKELIQVHAFEALRRTAEARFANGAHLAFANCCGGGGAPVSEVLPDPYIFQLQSQAGPIAYADC